MSQFTQVLQYYIRLLDLVALLLARLQMRACIFLCVCISVWKVFVAKIQIFPVMKRKEYYRWNMRRWIKAQLT